MYEIFSSGPVDTNSILFYSPESPAALLFDLPLGSVKHWQSRLQKLGKTIHFVLLTHSHWDHMADAALAKKTWNAPVGIHRQDEGNLKRPGSDGLPLFFPIEGIDPDFYVEDGEEKSFGSYLIKILHTPGHTPGGACFYLPEHKIVITGDTLFQGTIGNLSFPTARPALMKQSLKKVLQLPKDTVVLPGHGETTTIGKELDIVEKFGL